MARKPAWTTRGTISGRPAKATSWPRSVRARAMPRLGGRLPPPDQFNQRIRAISSSRYKSTYDVADDRCGGTAAQAEIAAQQLPRIDVGCDEQRVEEFSAIILAAFRGLRGEGLLGPAAMVVA